MCVYIYIYIYIYIYLHTCIHGVIIIIISIKTIYIPYKEKGEICFQSDKNSSF